MAHDIELHRLYAAQRIEQIRATVRELKPGRGGELATLMTHAVEKFDKAVAVIDEATATRRSELDGAALDDALLVYSKKFERLGPQLGTLYYHLAKYRHCVDREDVAIGLQHLLDVLMQQLIGGDADPMIYLDPIPMYSTVSLVDLLDEFNPESGINPAEGYVGRQPIVVNLPALNPSNALLAPVLAHEVAHTAVRRHLSELVRQQTSQKRASLSERASREAGADSVDWADTFDKWVDELLCDAVALVVSGPSFLFAFHGYLPPSNVPEIDDHPPLRDRMRFHLEVLQKLGWLPFVEKQAPSLLGWYESASKTVARSGHPIETFLLDAVRAVEEEILAVAQEYVLKPFAPVDNDAVLLEARKHLRDGVPAVQIDGEVLTTWTLILAGWLAVFAEDADPTKAMNAIDDSAYNAVLLKALELSSIVTKWEETKREQDERVDT